MYGILNGKQKCLSSSFSYFMDKTKFINFGHKLIFLVITNGNKEYFNNISKIISQNEGKNFNDNNNYTKTNDNNNQIKLLQETNKAFNIYFLYYPKYDEMDMKELNNKIKDKEDEFQRELKEPKEYFEKQLKEQREHFEKQKEELEKQKEQFEKQKEQFEKQQKEQFEKQKEQFEKQQKEQLEKENLQNLKNREMFNLMNEIQFQLKQLNEENKKLKTEIIQLQKK